MNTYTYFLNSDAVDVFPSGYRHADYTKARSMIEENFTNLTKFTDDQYRNFAYQLDSDKIVVNLSGYRFCISADALYELLIAKNKINKGDTSWECYLYIKTDDLGVNYGKVLKNLYKGEDGQISQLDDNIDNEMCFQGLGISAYDISHERDISYIKLLFNSTSSGDKFIHALTNKFLSISSLNIRNSNSDKNLNEQIDSNNGNLITTNTNNVVFKKYNSGKLSDTLARISAAQISSTNSSSVLLNFDSYTSSDTFRNVGKLGFSNQGELLISGETDNHSALRLSKKGDSTELSAGLTGPAAGDKTTSVRIIYQSDKSGKEDYLNLPKSPNLSSFNINNELIWVKKINSTNGTKTEKNDWIALDVLVNNLSNKVNYYLTGILPTYRRQVTALVDSQYDLDYARKIKPSIDSLDAKIKYNFDEPGGKVPTALSNMKKATDAANNAANTANNVAGAIKDDVDKKIAAVQKNIDDSIAQLSTDVDNLKTDLSNDVEAKIEDLEGEFNKLSANMNLTIVKVAYPVGSIFMSLKNTDPNIQLGINNAENLTIKWEKLDPDNYLSTGRSSGSYESVSYLNNDESLGLFKYGSDTIKLTANDLPKHRHGMAYGGDNGEYGDWIVLRSKNEVELAKTTETETGDNSMNFSTDPSSGYTDDIARYFTLLSYSYYNYHTDPGHESCRVPRRLYTAPNLRSDSSGRTLNRIIKNKASYIAYNPKSIAVNMWIRVK